MLLKIGKRFTQAIFLYCINSFALANPLDEAIHDGLRTPELYRYSMSDQSVTLGGLEESLLKFSFAQEGNDSSSGSKFSLIPGTPYTLPGGYSAVKEFVDVTDSLDNSIVPEVDWFQMVLPHGRIDYKRNSYAPGVERKERQHLGNMIYGATGSYLGFSKDTLNFGAGAFTIIRYNMFTNNKYPWGTIDADAKGDEPVDYVYNNLGQKYIESGQYMYDYFLVKKIEIQKQIDQFKNTNIADLYILEYETKMKRPSEIVEKIFDNYVPAHNSKAQKIQVIRDAKTREGQQRRNNIIRP